ncbi:hypothetical protein POM88_012162 [Heracleum sosnowskyi]|uniref:Uncharacterized protein n=1 Tax=Heracleum sosnowskyi TaxID=360622 RepID=A0AAD8N223_9APIA|nr:hypothetical protein POM88_012162 [Heracleum sosnowskyi]
MLNNYILNGLNNRLFCLDPVTSVKYLYLKNNSLTGAVPIWISTSKNFFDVSYNNFTETPKYSCQPSRVNLVSSYSSTTNNSDALEEGLFEVDKVHTDDNGSDMLTKSLAKGKLKVCCSIAGMANSFS